VVLGITGPVLRPLIQYPVIRQLQVLSHPAIALPLWVAVFFFWHIPPIYEFGVENELAHVVEHATFFATTALVWMSVVEPLPGPRWFGTGPKIAYLAAFWFVGLIIVNFFWFSGTVFYERYEDTAPAWGVSALQDQANAGSIFMAEHMLIVLTALVVLAIRASREGALRQALLEHGVERQRVLQAVRYGRAAELAEQVGASTHARPGID
jgi:cytochrome c oxidase assembly factor CtaG